ncbi:MAG: T9SS type A sorting domain-containing protein [Parabacteroides sp.]|nr:T9SS type A sorting domain-containing protein [Parabacteroides sp.]
MKLRTLLTKLSIALFVCFFSGNIFAQENLYVYKNNSTKTAYELDAIQRLTFLAEGLVIKKTDNTETMVTYADLRFFCLKNYTISAVETAQTGNISVCSDFINDLLIIKNEQTMSEIRLYNMQGQLLMVTQPQATEITLSVVDYIPGVYLLHIADGNGIHSQKIIKH